jgi:DNA mismatch repair ATPase MutL
VIHFHITPDKKIYVYPKCIDAFSEKNRLMRIFGNKIINTSFYINIFENNIILKGFFGKPEYNNLSKNSKYFYINNKFVHDIYIHNIINYAYYYINNSYFCNFYCLYLYLDSDMVDMSLYKSKNEIILFNNNIIYDLIKKIIIKLFSFNKINFLYDIDNKLGKNFCYNKRSVLDYIKKKNIKLIINKNIYEILSIFLNKILLIRLKNKLLVIDILKAKKFLFWKKCIIHFKEFGFLKKKIIKNIKFFVNKELRKEYIQFFDDLGIKLVYKNNFYYITSFPIIFSSYNMNYSLLLTNMIKKIYLFKVSFIHNITFYKNFIYLISDYICDDLAIKDLKDILLLFDNKNYYNKNFFVLLNPDSLLLYDSFY